MHINNSKQDHQRWICRLRTPKPSSCFVRRKGRVWSQCWAGWRHQVWKVRIVLSQQPPSVHVTLALHMFKHT